MVVKEEELSEPILEKLITLSEDWERESSCHGYQKNNRKDIEGKRIFLALDGEVIMGYLLGHNVLAEKTTSIYKAGNYYFEIDELYVVPQFRNCGIGKKLFQYAELKVTTEVSTIILATATKNFRSILHFYIDELGMEFWNAVLFKKLK